MRSEEEIKAHIKWFEQNDKSIDERLEKGHITRNTWADSKEKNEIKLRLLWWVLNK